MTWWWAIVRGAAAAALLVAVGITALGLCGELVATSWSLLLEQPAGVRPDEVLSSALVVVCTPALTAAWAWLLACLLGCMWEVVGHTPPRPSSALRPRFVRLLVGVAATSALATAPAAARAPAIDPSVAPTPLEPRVVEGLQLPDRVTGTGPSADAPPTGRSPTTTPPASDSTAGDSTAGTARTHLVRPGESLWQIAEQRLGSGSPPGAIDSAWRRIYRANRALIGPDPDLIHPGTPLVVPHAIPHPTGTGERP